MKDHRLIRRIIFLVVFLTSVCFAQKLNETGIARQDDEPVIINGVEITDRSLGFQHLARIQMSLLGLLSGSCTGSLISTNYVLTAGHCVKKTFLKLFRFPYKIKVVLGDLSKSQTESTEQTIPGIGFAYPGYPSQFGANDPKDIALIRLLISAQLNDNVQPIALDTSGSVPEGSTVIIAGWGSTTGTATEGSDKLLAATTTVLASSKCARSATEQMCLGNSASSSSVCYGDSGGPTMYNGKLVAVASFVVSSSCDPAESSGAVKVSAYASWIEGKMNG